MYVERFLPAAREKLVTIADDAPLTEAADFLRKGTPRDRMRFGRSCDWGHHKDGCCRPNEPVSGSELHDGSFIGDDARRGGLSGQANCSRTSGNE
jgi:hypothetical protein